MKLTCTTLALVLCASSAFSAGFGGYTDPEVIGPASSPFGTPDRHGPRDVYEPFRCPVDPLPWHRLVFDCPLPPVPPILPPEPEVPAVPLPPAGLLLIGALGGLLWWRKKHD